MAVISSALEQHTINNPAVYIPFVSLSKQTNKCLSVPTLKILYSCREAWGDLEGAPEAVQLSI